MESMIAKERKTQTGKKSDREREGENATRGQNDQITKFGAGTSLISTKCTTSHRT